MIQIMPESSGNVLGVKASGKLTDTDYKQVLIPKLATLFEQHGKLNVLFYMDEAFEGWDLEAAWDDASYGLKHRADFGKLALVGGPSWVDWCIKLSGFLMKGEIKIFPADQLDRAWAWIKS
jgi:hypothetical protein